MAIEKWKFKYNNPTIVLFDSIHGFVLLSAWLCDFSELLWPIIITV